MARGNATMTRHGPHKVHGLPSDVGSSHSSRGDDKDCQAQSTISKRSKGGAKDRTVVPVSRLFQFRLSSRDSLFVFTRTPVT